MPKEDLIRHWKYSKLIKNKSLIKAFRSIPREKFVLPEYRDQAYVDSPLPIPAGQTISQPTTVMIMIDALDLKKTDRVLEIGSGSGWNAALMSKLVKHIYTIEYIKELADFSKKNLKNLKIKNVTVIHGDGSKGLPKYAPFNKIIVTAACPRIPKPLISQLKEDGILLAPVGSKYSQDMIKGVKKKGKLITENLGSFIFVQLKGHYGFI